MYNTYIIRQAHVQMSHDHTPYKLHDNCIMKRVLEMLEKAIQFTGIFFSSFRIDEIYVMNICSSVIDYLLHIRI